MAYTANDAFCAQTDVEATVQRGTFTSGTFPTAQQVLDCMARRAAEIESVLASEGQPYTVQTRGSAFPGSPSASVGRLKVLCEMANAQGAAADVAAMHAAKGGVVASEDDIAWMVEYRKTLDAIRELCEAMAAATRPTPLTVQNDSTLVNLPFTTTTEW